MGTGSRRGIVIALFVAGLIGAAGLTIVHHTNARRPLTIWPWPGAEESRPLAGLTVWHIAGAARRPASVDLVEFDFAARPTLRLELYDQDQNDDVPFDNHASLRRGVLAVSADLDRSRPGAVLAAWNGLFYAVGADQTGSHIAPVVLHGEVHYNVGNYRWTVGVKERDGKSQFSVLHLPDKALLAAQFDYAAAGAQCLIKDGVPLRMLPQPQPGDPPLPRTYPSSPEDVGAIPDIDYLHVSRTSMGWSADSGKLWLLIVRAADGQEGWTLADLQRFWTAFGAANAVNLDGGPETQMVLRVSPDRSLLVPSGKSGSGSRMNLALDGERDPGGGSLMTFYVRDTAEEAP